MRASGSPDHPPSKSQQAPCFGPEMITRKEPLAPHRNSRPFWVFGGPSRSSARAAMDERNAGRSSSRIEALPIVVFDQFRCAANAHRRVPVRRTHAVKSRSNSRAPARAISTPRTPARQQLRYLGSAADNKVPGRQSGLFHEKANGLLGSRGLVVDDVSLDDHDREGLALFAENRLGNAFFAPLAVARFVTYN
jgi:hypothetical protein